MTEFSSETFEALRKEKLAYLTTVGRKTGKTHTVELWFSTAGGSIFLSHEGERTDWMKNIARNGNVRIRIGKLNFEAKASVLRDVANNELGKKSLYEKYYGPASKEVIDDWFELSQIIELKPAKTPSVPS